MPRNWRRYVTRDSADAGRAMILQGVRIKEAQTDLTQDAFAKLLRTIRMHPRDARTLAHIGHRLSPILSFATVHGFPFRIRTLNALADLSNAQLQELAQNGTIHRGMTEADAKRHRAPADRRNPSIIKPTDSWNFHNLRWPRIDQNPGHGYIPGEIYANCIWYYCNDGDTILDPMAGSGMIHRVWEDRKDWYIGEHPNITIQMSDLSPAGPFTNLIRRCDLLNDPINLPADYIIIDPPYCGVAAKQYSDSPNDLANMEPTDWCLALAKIALKCRSAQDLGGRCTVIVPNHRSITTGDRILCTEVARSAFKRAGYTLIDVVYASRRVQKSQGRRMAILNNLARANRNLMADTAEILTFAVS